MMTDTRTHAGFATAYTRPGATKHCISTPINIDVPQVHFAIAEPSYKPGGTAGFSCSTPTQQT